MLDDRPVGVRAAGASDRDGYARWLSARLIPSRVAEDLFARGICLPSSSSLTAEELDRVIGAVRSACRAKAGCEER